METSGIRSGVILLSASSPVIPHEDVQYVGRPAIDSYVILTICILGEGAIPPEYAAMMLKLLN